MSRTKSNATSKDSAANLGFKAKCRTDDYMRWQFGVPPKDNANFAWVQHFIHHLAPQGLAGFGFAISPSLNSSFCYSGR